MFPLHDRTRRKLVLTVFFTGCLLPTLGIFVWGVSRRLPGHDAAEARRLGAMLGMRVSIGRVVYARPGQLRYEKLALYDPESGRRLLECESLEVDRCTTGSEEPQSLMLHARKPVLNAAGGAAVLDLLERVMRRQTGPAAGPLAFSADELTFNYADAPVRLAGLHGIVTQDPAAAKCQIRFAAAEASAGEPAYCEIDRNRKTSPARLGLKVYTGASPLPCRLLGLAVPALGPLGPDCRFRGYLEADRTADGWQGELTGQFSNVDLGRLVEQRFGQQLKAAGQITIHQARFESSRLIEGHGQLALGPGTIGRPLFEASVAELGLREGACNAPHDTPPAPNAPLPFDRLAAHWRISPEGLWLKGACRNSPPGTILAREGERLLGESAAQPQPAAALVRTLAPRRKAEVPAAPECAWLLRYLPARVE